MTLDRVIGVDLGGTKLLAGAVDAQLVVHSRATRLAGGIGRDELLDLIADGVREAIAATDGTVWAVGIGIPSLIDQARGVAVTTVHLPITDLPVAELLSERLQLPVFVDNDANCAMLAEHRYGAARGTANAVLLTIGTGIGNGLVVGGQLVRGASGSAGEFGHMSINADGPRCRGACPNRGCLEVYVSGPALAELGERAAAADPHGALATAGRPISGPLVTELAQRGDVAALDCVVELGRALGVGITNLVNGLNPEVVVIGGGLIALGDLLLDPARDVMRERALSPSKDVVRIVPAAFGAESGMLGAAVLALEEIK